MVMETTSVGLPVEFEGIVDILGKVIFPNLYSC